MVIWSGPARADLRAIHDFIAHDSRHYAKKVTQEIVAKTDLLHELPRVGKMVPEINKEAVGNSACMPTVLFMKSRIRTFMCWQSSINAGIYSRP